MSPDANKENDVVKDVEERTNPEAEVFIITIIFVDVELSDPVPFHIV